jgi:hypothetical protein
LSNLSPERWQAVGPHLDRALDMTDTERAACVAALRAQDPTLAADLEMLLEEHRTLTRHGFLEQPAAPMPGVARPAPPSLEGQAFGDYTLVSPIGEGGMGTVWLARRSDGRYEREVAIKSRACRSWGPVAAARAVRARADFSDGWRIPTLRP